MLIEALTGISFSGMFGAVLSFVENSHIGPLVDSLSSKAIICQKYFVEYFIVPGL